jgi:uncharacterized Zn finger protein
VTIKFRKLSDAEWGRIIDGMASEALYAARLLSGEMPEQIEDVFAAAGTSLFPRDGDDMQTNCSCPDWANPCKHIAAVHYLLGERFDEDPFLMFLLRGRSQEDIITALRARRTACSGDSGRGCRRTCRRRRITCCRSGAFRRTRRGRAALRLA